jgi:hypothetical protein
MPCGNRETSDLHLRSTEVEVVSKLSSSRNPVSDILLSAAEQMDHT